MKYVKTFESFRNDFNRQNQFNFNVESLNENLLDDIINFFRNIWDYISEKAQDFVDFIGDKWNEFKNKINEISESIINLVGDKLGAVIKNVEKLFGKPAHDLTLEDIKRGLKNMPKVQTLSASNEEFTDRAIGEFSDKDPLVQKVLAILEGVFLVNTVSCFAPLAWILGLFATGGIVSGMFLSMITSFLAIGIFTVIRNMLYKSAEKTKEKIKDPAFLRKKEELIDYMTGTDAGWKLGAIMSSKEPRFADITQDGEIDTEMMTFKRGDILIFSGVSFYSSGEINYVTTVRNMNGDILLEPFFSSHVEELNSSIRKTIESGIKTPVDNDKKVIYKTYGDENTLDRVMSQVNKNR